MEYILSLIIGCSALIQGGFYPVNYLAFGIIMMMLCVFQRNLHVTIPELFLFGLSLVYLITSVKSGYSLESLSKACLPAVYTGFLHLYLGLSEEKRSFVLDWVTIGSGIAAGFAILAFCGVLSIRGAVASHRLQFTFQYANAAGSWFAAVSLQANGRKPNVRRFILPCTVALLLTKSIGALLLYSLLLMFGICVKKQRIPPDELMSVSILAILFAAAFAFFPGFLPVVILGILYTVMWNLETVIVQAGRFRKLLRGLAIGGIGAGILLLGQRLPSSFRTFAERIIQIHDGLRILCDNPLLGVGAGRWSVWYPYYQSAQYVSSVIHSSLIQIAVDAGIIAMIIAILFAVFAWRRHNQPTLEKMAAMLLLFHSLVDFNLLFFPIGALLLSLLFYRYAEQKTIVCRFPLLLGVSCLTCTVFAAMFYGQAQNKQLKSEIQNQSWASAIGCFETNRILFGDSTEETELYLTALYHTNQFDEIVRITDKLSIFSENQLLLRAEAIQLQGRQEEACGFLLTQLEKQQYCVSLFQRAAQLLREWEADAQCIARYNQIVDEANQNQNSLARWKGDQVYIEKISLRGA